MDEFELIDEITAHLPQRANVLLGPGDDAALLATPDGSVLASTDILVEGVHFRRDWTTPYALGRRAAAQNLADIAAMGATATALLVAVAAPRGTAPSWFTELARGLQDECALVGASVIGGDLSRGDAVVVSVTVLADRGPGAPVLRSGARPGDVVAVAGRLGWSMLGLLALQRGTAVDAAIVDAYRAPAPPYGAGPAARAAGATAMIDVSDGLLADAGHIAHASDVTIDIASHLVDTDEQVRAAAQALGVSSRTAVLTGGEDHALLATFPAGHPLPEGFRLVGHVAMRGAHAVLVDGAPHEGPHGYDHFSEDAHHG